MSAGRPPYHQRLKQPVAVQFGENAMEDEDAKESDLGQPNHARCDQRRDDDTNSQQWPRPIEQCEAHGQDSQGKADADDVGKPCEDPHDFLLERGQGLARDVPKAIIRRPQPIPKPRRSHDEARSRTVPNKAKSMAVRQSRLSHGSTNSGPVSIEAPARRQPL